MIVQIVLMILAIIFGITHWNVGEHQRFTSFCVLFLLQVINISYDNIEKEISGILIQPIFDDLLLIKERGILIFDSLKQPNCVRDEIGVDIYQFVNITWLTMECKFDVVRWFHVYEYILHKSNT